MKKWILILFFSILIGLYFGLGTIFGFFKLLLFFGLSTLIFIVLILIWQKQFRKRNYAIRIYLTICFGLIFSLLIFQLKKAYNQHNANLLTEQIIDFRNNNNRLPNSIAELKKDTELPKYFDQFELKDFEYSLNQKTNEFNLSYSLDGWHINEFNSKTKEWETRD
ncbi:hypothetical protein WJN01_15350 [Flavobacteriaceae bacterium SZ-1-7]|uniref:hypothetical protein n=1 Tax=Tamlana sedimenti TaxID=3134126 RepID=UPI003121B061